MCLLSGLRIVVTRAVHQAEELAIPLRTLGADVIVLPMIGIAPPADPEPLRRAAANFRQYEWVIFTSANAVTAFAAALPDSRLVSAVRVAVIGPATRQAAQNNGFAVNVMPSEYIAEALAQALGSEQLAGKRILIPSAASTRDVLPQSLRAGGAIVDVVEGYRNVIPADSSANCSIVFRDPLPDWVTFASSSAVDNTVDVVGTEILSRVRLAAIGPPTARSLARRGLSATTEAIQHSIAGLVQAICVASGAK